jgi:hypothetical protein
MQWTSTQLVQIKALVSKLACPGALGFTLLHKVKSLKIIFSKVYINKEKSFKIISSE